MRIRRTKLTAKGKNDIIKPISKTDLVLEDGHAEVKDINDLVEPMDGHV